MHKKRFNLPPLDLIQGFEAAARNLSFTKAAEELLITQSAVSRQIRALEDHLGVTLFERRPRTLALTEQGRTLQRAAAELLERLQQVTDEPASAERSAPQLTVTTTNGFASLWLIPRLRGFTALHPDRRRAHLGDLPGPQPGAQPGRRGGALLPAGQGAAGGRPPVRRGPVSRVQPDAAEESGTAAAEHRGLPAPHAAVHGRAGRQRHVAGVGHLACGAWPRRPQAGGVAALRHLRADHRRGGERAGHRHGDRPADRQPDCSRASWWRRSAVGRRPARLLHHTLGGDRRAPARAGLRRLADRGGERPGVRLAAPAHRLSSRSRAGR